MLHFALMLAGTLTIAARGENLGLAQNHFSLTSACPAMLPTGGRELSRVGECQRDQEHT